MKIEQVSTWCKKHPSLSMWTFGGFMIAIGVTILTGSVGAGFIAVGITGVVAAYGLIFTK